MSTIKILTVFSPKLSFVSSNDWDIPSRMFFLHSLSNGIIKFEIGGDEKFSFLMITINHKLIYLSETSIYLNELMHA